MTKNEIKEAIVATKEISKWLDGEGNGRHYTVLLSLAEEYLKIKGWPEERKPTNFQGKDYSNPTDEEFNSTLRLCKLAAMKEKSKVSRETLCKILNYHTNVRKILGSTEQEFIVEALSDVEALLELINGKEA